jgi:hypothetical protein
LAEEGSVICGFADPAWRMLGMSLLFAHRHLAELRAREAAHLPYGRISVHDRATCQARRINPLSLHDDPQRRRCSPIRRKRGLDVPIPLIGTSSDRGTAALAECFSALEQGCFRSLLYAFGAALTDPDGIVEGVQTAGADPAMSIGAMKWRRKRTYMSSSMTR